MLRAVRLGLQRRPCSATSHTLIAPRAVRHASTMQAVRYPYPTTPHPTPHQIFHLSPGSSQDQIKDRYFELVRVHHPDAPASRSLPSTVAQTRFLEIKKAYDILRGMRPGVAGDVPGESTAARAKRDLDAAIWRAKQARRADDFGSGGDDRWKDRALVGLVLVAIIAFVAQSALIRRKALAENIEYSKMRREDRAARRNKDEGEPDAVV